jgi:hypothetical protein
MGASKRGKPLNALRAKGVEKKEEEDLLNTGHVIARLYLGHSS